MANKKEGLRGIVWVVSGPGAAPGPPPPARSRGERRSQGEKRRAWHGLRGLRAGACLLPRRALRHVLRYDR